MSDKCEMCGSDEEYCSHCGTCGLCLEEDLTSRSNTIQSLQSQLEDVRESRQIYKEKCKRMDEAIELLKTIADEKHPWCMEDIKTFLAKQGE